MRREEAREGVEFRLNDFRPSWRGTRSPSTPSRRRLGRKRELYLAIGFTIIGFLIIFVFHSMERSSVPNRQVAKPSIAIRQTSKKVPMERAESRGKTATENLNRVNSRSLAGYTESTESVSEDILDDELVRKIKARMKSLTEKIDVFLANH